MSKETAIQWCDSSANIQMGCEGCELVKGREKNVCYAKKMTDRYAGRNGWPEAFEKPKIFMERVRPMVRWPDLTGTERPDKPWLNGMPRIIFLNDMGDTFTGGLSPDEDKDWFRDVLETIWFSPHQYLVLTKWPRRFAEFSQKYHLPPNIWAGASVTSNKTKFRIRDLQRVQGAKIKWLSIEPLWDDLTDIDDYLDGIDWVVVGGESGTGAAPCMFDWIARIVTVCHIRGIPVFVKQLGSALAKTWYLKDGHGGDQQEWPYTPGTTFLHDKRVRQMPRL